MGHLNGEALVFRCKKERRHQVEPEERQVGQVIISKGFTLQMRMDQPEPSEPLLAEGAVGKVRDEKTSLVADDDILHPPRPVDDDADLAVDLPGKLHHPRGQFGAYHLVYRHTSPIEPLKASNLALFETCQVSTRIAYLRVLSGRGKVFPVTSR